MTNQETRQVTAADLGITVESVPASSKYKLDICSDANLARWGAMAFDYFVVDGVNFLYWCSDGRGWQPNDQQLAVMELLVLYEPAMSDVVANNILYVSDFDFESKESRNERCAKLSAFLSKFFDLNPHLDLTGGTNA